MPIKYSCILLVISLSFPWRQTLECSFHKYTGNPRQVHIWTVAVCSLGWLVETASEKWILIIDRGNCIWPSTSPSVLICKHLNYMPVWTLVLILSMNVYTVAGCLRFMVLYVCLPVSLGESVLAFGEVIPSFNISRHETFSDDTDTSSNTCFVDQH